MNNELVRKVTELLRAFKDRYRTADWLEVEMDSFTTELEEPLLKLLGEEKDGSMNTGDKVRIFEDPVTEQKLEGKAILYAKTGTPDLQLDDGSHLEFWLVVFPNGEQGYRKIKVKELKELKA